MLGSLVVQSGPYEGVVVDIQDDLPRFVVGRADEADLTLDDVQVSRGHLALYVREGQLFVEDLGSANGTFVNGRRVEDEVALRPGDSIRAGGVVFVFRGPGEDAEKRGKFTGKKLARHLVGELIGSGGMGEVYKAVQESLGRPAAIKILAPELASDPEYVERFLREARSAGELEHPNVIHVYDVGEDEGIYYYSMEFVDGGSVQDLISGGRSLSQTEAARIALETARALEYAESKRIVHCDVKPDNIMLTADGRVKLADLGIAKRITHGRKTEGEAAGVFGSPHFMSPEQAMGKPLDQRTDIYSLGAALYRMLSGRTLYPGDDSREIMEKQVYEEAADILEVAPSIDPRLGQLLRRMLAKRPQERCQSASSVVNGLEKLVSELKEPAETLTMPATRRRRGRAAPSKTVTVAIAGVAVVIALVVLMRFLLGPGYLSPEEVAEVVAAARKAISDDEPQQALRILEEKLPHARPEDRHLIDELSIEARKKEQWLKDRAGLAGKIKELETALGTATEIPDLKRLSIKADVLDKEAVRLLLTGVLIDLKKRIDAKALRIAKAHVKAARRKSAFLEAAWRYGEARRLWKRFPRDTAAIAGIVLEAEAAAVSGRTEPLEQILAEEAKALAAQDAVGLGKALLGLFAQRSGREEISDAELKRRPARPVSKERAEFLANRALVEEGMYLFADAARTRRMLVTALGRTGDEEGAKEAESALKLLHQRNAVFMALVDAVNNVQLTDNSVTLPDGRTFKVVGADNEMVRLKGEEKGFEIAWGVLPPMEFFGLAAAAPFTPKFALLYAEYAIEKGCAEEARSLAGKAGAASTAFQREAREVTKKANAVDPGAYDMLERQLAAVTKGMLVKLVERNRPEEAWWFYQVLEYRFDRGRGIVSEQEAKALGQDLVRLKNELEKRRIAAEQMDDREEEALKALGRKTVLGHAPPCPALFADVYLAEGNYAHANMKAEGAERNYRNTQDHPHLLLIKAAALAGQGGLENMIEATRVLNKVADRAGELPPSLGRLAGRLDLLLSGGDVPKKHLRLLEEARKKEPFEPETHRRLFFFRSAYLPFPADWIKTVEVASLLGIDLPGEDTAEPLRLASAMLRCAHGPGPDVLMKEEDAFLRYGGADAALIEADRKKAQVPAEALEVLRGLKQGEPDFLHNLTGAIKRRLEGAR